MAKDTKEKKNGRCRKINEIFWGLFGGRTRRRASTT